MPKLIEVPGQGVIEFPDNMSDDEISGVLKKQFPPQNDKMAGVRAKLQETDRILGLPPGTSERQIQTESSFDPFAMSPKGARGLAQVMPDTQASLEKRFGRKLDPYNEEDSLLMHRELMRENLAKFGNVDDALRAYNAGWDRNRWDNTETNNYIAKIRGGQVQPTRFAQVPKKISQDELNTTPDWLEAAKILYNMWERKPYEGTDEDASEWLKDSMANFNYNMVSMAQIANAVTSASDEEKQAFLWAMDTYDNVEMSWEGTGRAVQSLATDPLTYVGLGTFGVGLAGKVATKQAEKAALRQLLVQSLGRSGTIAAAEGAVYAGTSNVIRQSVEVSGGRRDEISLTEAGAAAGIGAVAGATLGTLFDFTATKLTPSGKQAVDKITNLFRKKPVDEVPTQAMPTEAPRTAQEAPNEAPNTQARVTPENVPQSVLETPQGPVPTRDPNLGSNLTAEELQGAMARRQPGRLPEDDVVPEVPAGTAFDIPRASTAGARMDGPVSMDAQAQAVAPYVDALREVPTNDLRSVVESIRQRSDLSLDDIPLVSRMLQDYAKELKVQQASLIKTRESLLTQIRNSKSPRPDLEEQVGRITAQLEDLQSRDSAILADDATGTLAGVLLRQRQEGLQGVNGVTPESIMAEQGLSREQAEAVWAEMVSKAELDARVKQVEGVYDAQIQRLIDEGKLVEAGVLNVKKRQEVASITDTQMPKSAGLIRKMTEAAISNVFSLTTVVINFVPSALKTLVIPFMKALTNNPVERATRAELVASYTAMTSSFRAALQAAKAGFMYEQAILTREDYRLFESGLALKGRFGAAVRFFPRVLNASDEFLSRINYDSYIAGKAAAEAAMEGSEKGLKGRELTKYIKEATKESLEKSRSVDDGDELIQPVVNKGLNLGLSGDALWTYVEREVAKNPEILKKGTNEEALNYVRDLLYKRAFSGTNIPSKFAESMEGFLNRHPGWKLLSGQLFFRTPIRVFEEGIRLTPGLQVIAPGYMADLAGRNGVQKQVKAQSEALLSLGVAGAVLSLYAQGRITGDGVYENYRQQKVRRDGPNPEPYTIQLDDGSTWSYRRFDPLATPMKIMVNALERHDKMRMREAQGDYVDANEYKKVTAAIGISIGAVAMALRDAALVEGVDSTLKLAENIADPESSESSLLKFLGDKLYLTVPSTLHKIARENDPTLKDPASFWQVVEDKLLQPFGQEIDVPFAYDVLGNKRTMADTGTLWNVFSTASVEERSRGMSQDALDTMVGLDRLTKITGTTFTPPNRHRNLPGTDLRRIMAADGERTLYDVWMQNYRSLEPEKVLAPILRSDLPVGSRKFKGMKEQEVAQTMAFLYDSAFQITMSQEQEVIDRYIKAEVNKAKAKAGAFEVSRPY